MKPTTGKNRKPAALTNLSFSKRMKRCLFDSPYTYAACLLALVGAGATCQAGSPSTDFTVIERYPHDINAYTQGFVFDNGIIYESTGRL
ncbi:MAG: glutaminyl-peptide cyclotransferase, partial [Myxococcota bacterium]|nr:glutaminyl-peptide cyclotransferase [Myxococcota bacterium]